MIDSNSKVGGGGVYKSNKANYHFKDIETFLTGNTVITKFSLHLNMCVYNHLLALTLALFSIKSHLLTRVLQPKLAL